jgi:hypothetical protein
MATTRIKEIMNQFSRSFSVSALCVLLLNGCASSPWEAHESETERVGDNLVRYGTVAGLGAGGYFAGRAIGGNDTAGGIGAAVGATAGVVYNWLSDRNKAKAYKAGLQDGANQARAEQLNEQWKREAIYGLPPEGQSNKVPVHRRVYVPERTVNGVKYRGGYQDVVVYQ